jgi:hypothetical protein
VFTARYALSPYIKQIRFFFKGLSTTTSQRMENGGIIPLLLTFLMFNIPVGVCFNFHKKSVTANSVISLYLEILSNSRNYGWFIPYIFCRTFCVSVDTPQFFLKLSPLLFLVFSRDWRDFLVLNSTRKCVCLKIFEIWYVSLLKSPNKEI